MVGQVAYGRLGFRGRGPRSLVEAITLALAFVLAESRRESGGRSASQGDLPQPCRGGFSRAAGRTRTACPAGFTPNCNSREPDRKAPRGGQAGSLRPRSADPGTGKPPIASLRSSDAGIGRTQLDPHRRGNRRTVRRQCGHKPPSERQRSFGSSAGSWVIRARYQGPDRDSLRAQRAWPACTRGSDYQTSCVTAVRVRAGGNGLT